MADGRVDPEPWSLAWEGGSEANQGPETATQQWPLLYMEESGEGEERLRAAAEPD